MPSSLVANPQNIVPGQPDFFNPERISTRIHTVLRFQHFIKATLKQIIQDESDQDSVNKKINELYRKVQSLYEAQEATLDFINHHGSSKKLTKERLDNCFSNEQNAFEILMRILQELSSLLPGRYTLREGHNLLGKEIITYLKHSLIVFYASLNEDSLGLEKIKFEAKGPSLVFLSSGHCEYTTFLADYFFTEMDGNFCKNPFTNCAFTDFDIMHLITQGQLLELENFRDTNKILRLLQSRVGLSSNLLLFKNFKYAEACNNLLEQGVKNFNEMIATQHLAQISNIAFEGMESLVRSRINYWIALKRFYKNYYDACFTNTFTSDYEKTKSFYKMIVRDISSAPDFDKMQCKMLALFEVCEPILVQILNAVDSVALNEPVPYRKELFFLHAILRLVPKLIATLAQHLSGQDWLAPCWTELNLKSEHCILLKSKYSFVYLLHRAQLLSWNDMLVLKEEEIQCLENFPTLEMRPKIKSFVKDICNRRWPDHSATKMKEYMVLFFQKIKEDGPNAISMTFSSFLLRKEWYYNLTTATLRDASLKQNDCLEVMWFTKEQRENYISACKASTTQQWEISDCFFANIDTSPEAYEPYCNTRKYQVY